MIRLWTATVMALAVFLTAQPTFTVLAANLINTTSFTNSSGATCVKRSFDDGSDIIACASVSEVEIIDVPVPFVPLAEPSGSSTTTGGDTSGGTATGGDTSGGTATSTSGGSSGGGSAANKAEQDRRSLIEADETRRTSGSRAKSRLGYDDVTSVDEGSKPKRRGKDWGN